MDEGKSVFDKLVVDSNILFSALIKRGAAFELMIQMAEHEVQLYSPGYLWKEVSARKEKILMLSGLQEAELDFFMGILSEQLIAVQQKEYKEFITEAKSLLKPHIKDVPYFALALALDSPIWSNEKRFLKQPKVKIYSSTGLYDLFLAADGEYY